MLDINHSRIAIIGLGYVGLPLAVEFGKHLPTIGYDISGDRIEALRTGRDETLELTEEELSSAELLSFSTDAKDISDCNIYIVTVPTPIDRHHQPDLRSLQNASRLVGQIIADKDIVIFESTVYPGCTEEVCVPLIEEESGLTYNRDFYAGYSPERINPGDKAHRVTNITKVTSGSTPEIAGLIDQLYQKIVTAGTHKASSIMVAEAAKVIENTQRDVNIALINELALIFGKLGIDTLEVLEAAATKWNFLPFKPGLVGGHCIGVDPYYLTHKAQEIGYHPEMILSGRRINDSMGERIADQVAKMMTQKQIHVVDSRVLVMGLAFKENCPDLRNSKVIDVVRGFQSAHAQVDIFDPWADPKEARAIYGVELVKEPQAANYDAIITCVAHQEFIELGIAGINKWVKPNHVIFDVKGFLPKDAIDGRL